MDLISYFIQAILKSLIIPLRIIRLCVDKEDLNEYTKRNNEILRRISENPETILSWNIQEMYIFSNDYKVNNIIDQIYRINSDLVCLQEVYEDSSKKRIIKELSIQYPYNLITNTEKKYFIGEDSGLLILSKYEIELVNEVLLEDFTDSFSNKSIIYFKIRDLKFATTHLRSLIFSPTTDQIESITKKSPFDEFILIGDLNNYNAYEVLKIDKNNTSLSTNYILPLGYFNMSIDVQACQIYNNTFANLISYKPVGGIINYGLYI